MFQLIRDNFKLLSENSTFELDTLLTRILTSSELVAFIYEIYQSTDSGISMLEHIFSILIYDKNSIEDCLDDKQIEDLKLEIMKKIEWLRSYR